MCLWRATKHENRKPRRRSVTPAAIQIRLQAGLERDGCALDEKLFFEALAVPQPTRNRSAGKEVKP